MPIATLERRTVRRLALRRLVATDCDVGEDGRWDAVFDRAFNSFDKLVE